MSIPFLSGFFQELGLMDRPSLLSPMYLIICLFALAALMLNNNLLGKRELHCDRFIIQFVLKCVVQTQKERDSVRNKDSQKPHKVGPH